MTIITVKIHKTPHDEYFIEQTDPDTSSMIGSSFAAKTSTTLFTSRDEIDLDNPNFEPVELEIDIFESTVIETREISVDY